MRKLEAGESINIVVAPDGTVTVKALGVKGNGCLEVTKPFESLGEVTRDKATVEMNQEPESNEHRNRTRR